MKICDPHLIDLLIIELLIGKELLFNYFCVNFCVCFWLVIPGSPVTRWASVAFGAGVGIGTAYTECSYILDGLTAKWTPAKVSTVPPVVSNQVRLVVTLLLFNASYVNCTIL